MMKTLSIIIPSFNTKKALSQCLLSIFRETKRVDFEVIIIDNASSDGSVEQIKSLRSRSENYNKRLKIIVNKENFGFAKAVNQGIRRAKGNYLLFLNSDTIILNRAIEKSLEFIGQKRDIDILGCRLLHKNRKIQPSAGFFPQIFRIIKMMFFIDDLPFLRIFLKPYHQNRKSFYQKERELDWVTGAFLLVKRKVIEKIGGLDEDFFMYGEEVDFCYRAKKNGFRVYFYPQAKIIHLKGKSSVYGFEKAVLAEYQGLIKFYHKHKPKWQRIILRLALKMGACLRIFVFGILKQKNKKRIYEKAFKLV